MAKVQGQKAFTPIKLTPAVRFLLDRSERVQPVPEASCSNRQNFRSLTKACNTYAYRSLKFVPGLANSHTITTGKPPTLINASQDGVTNLLDFYHYVFSECDCSRAMDVVYLDFRKAFDNIPHKRYMRKVRVLGIQNNVAAWIENWLAGGRQRVINHHQW